LEQDSRGNFTIGSLSSYGACDKALLGAFFLLLLYLLGHLLEIQHLHVSVPPMNQDLFTLLGEGLCFLVNGVHAILWLLLDTLPTPLWCLIGGLILGFLMPHQNEQQ
jgi:hypothetical protein